MPAEKRNAFLDAGDSEEEDGLSYDSENDIRKGGPSRAKRRKVDSDSSGDEGRKTARQAGKPGRAADRAGDSSSSDDNDEDDIDDAGANAGKAKPADADAIDDDDSDDDDNDEVAGAAGRTPAKLRKKNLVRSEKAVRRSGVVYLSRIPPFMKPAKLRSLLAPYGAVNRIFLSPEDPAAHTRRVRNGGNKRRSFVDGWVEFVRKRDARRAVDLLNGATIGGKKRSYYRDDIWSLVYLRGFKWHHLTEQIAAENAERTARLQVEIAQSRKENEAFVRNVESAKMLNGIEAKKKKKQGAEADGGDRGDGDDSRGPGEGDDSEPRLLPDTKRIRKFKQTPRVVKPSNDDQPEHVQRVLNKIF